ncbi:hypothetical protein LA080_015430 [Diaporthe eres]|nr:hypothetical protein LA080_015430 [Diaporthe eres]
MRYDGSTPSLKLNQRGVGHEDAPSGGHGLSVTEVDVDSQVGTWAKLGIWYWQKGFMIGPGAQPAARFGLWFEQAELPHPCYGFLQARKF